MNAPENFLQEQPATPVISEGDIADAERQITSLRNKLEEITKNLQSNPDALDKKTLLEFEFSLDDLSLAVKVLHNMLHNGTPFDEEMISGHKEDVNFLRAKAREDLSNQVNSQ